MSDLMGTTTVVVCDAGVSQGVGHLMRCLALAQEVHARGGQVELVCNADEVGWAHQQVLASPFGLRRWPPDPDLVPDLVRDLGPDLVVVDSYTLAPRVHQALRGLRAPVLALVDNELRGAVADLYVDQNIGSEDDAVQVPAGSRRLGGLAYALLGDEVRRARPAEPPQPRDTDAPVVSAFFGGTDPAGAGPEVVRVLVATGLAFDLRIIAPRPGLRASIEAHHLGEHQRVRVLAPSPGAVVDLARSSDLVIAAAGSSTWELLALGAAVGLVCVADNQAVSYRRIQATGAAVGLGTVAELASPSWSPESLRRLLMSATYRGELASRGWRLVDGDGRVRVLDAFLGVRRTT